MSFRLTIPIESCYVQKSFDADGNEIERKYVSGIASGTELDRDTEKMAYSALDAMRQAITDGILTEKGEVSQVPLYSEHKAEELEKLGWLTKAWIEKHDGEAHELWIEAELDTDNPKANLLYKKLTTPTVKGRPVQLGLSISGRVTKARKVWDAAVSKKVTEFLGILLKEVSVVTKPAYAPSYLEVLEKSFKEDEDTVGDIFMEDEINLEAQKAEANGSTAAEGTSEETTKTVADAAAETQTDAVAKNESDQLSEGAAKDESVEKAADDKLGELVSKMSILEALVDELRVSYANLSVSFYPKPKDEDKFASEQGADAADGVAKEETPAEQPEPAVAKAEAAMSVDVLKQAITDAIAEQVTPLVTKLTTLETQMTEITSTAVDKSMAALGSDDVDPKDAALRKYATVKEEAVKSGRDFDPIAAGLEIWKQSLVTKATATKK